MIAVALRPSRCSSARSARLAFAEADDLLDDDRRRAHAGERNRPARRRRARRPDSTCAGPLRLQRLLQQQAADVGIAAAAGAEEGRAAGEIATSSEISMRMLSSPRARRARRPL